MSRRLPLFALAVLLYALRPPAYLAVLHHAGAARMPFDRHGYGLLGDTLLLALLALPLAGLLVWCWRRYRPGRPLLAPATTPARTALSFAVALAIALPPPAQWDALRYLRLTEESWPVALSALAWLGVVLVLRAGVVAPERGAAPLGLSSPGV